MIWENIDDFVKYLNDMRVNEEIPLAVVATCGGFDPVHIGHVRCFKESKRIKYSRFPNAIFVIIANGDGFLINKKGYAFMPEKERMEILSAFDGVDHVVKWYDGSQNCIGALEKIRPNIFTKGGDRSSEDKIPEAEICKRIGCEIIFGVGGTDKPQSSSWLISAMKDNETK